MPAKGHETTSPMRWQGVRSPVALMLMRGMDTGRSARASAAALLAVLLVASLSTLGWAAGRPPKVTPKGVSGPHRPVCGAPANGAAKCHAAVITKADGATPAATTRPFHGPP